MTNKASIDEKLYNQLLKKFNFKFNEIVTINVDNKNEIALKEL